MTFARPKLWSAHARLVATGDRSVTLVELTVAMLLTTILLGVVIAPTRHVDQRDGEHGIRLTGNGIGASRRPRHERRCHVGQPGSVSPPSSPRRRRLRPAPLSQIKTNVFGSVKWEQWWLNPSTNQLLAETLDIDATFCHFMADSSQQHQAYHRAANPAAGSRSASLLPRVGFRRRERWRRVPIPQPVRPATTAATPGHGPTPSTSTPPSPAQFPRSAHIASGHNDWVGDVTNQLAVAGSSGTVTYAKTAVVPASVTSSGKIATTGALAAGDYTGRYRRMTSIGDTGTWIYTLHVYTPPAAGAIAQTSPTSGTVTTTGSGTFTDQLVVTGDSGTVTYTQSTGNPGITIFSLPATNAAVTLMIALTASSGTKATAVSVPLRSAITALDTVFTSGPGTCMVGLGLTCPGH